MNESLSIEKLEKSFDKSIQSVYNNYRKWRNHKRGQPQISVLTHLTRESLQMCLFFGLFALTK